MNDSHKGNIQQTSGHRVAALCIKMHTDDRYFYLIRPCFPSLSVDIYYNFMRRPVFCRFCLLNGVLVQFLLLEGSNQQRRDATEFVMNINEVFQRIR